MRAGFRRSCATAGMPVSSSSQRDSSAISSSAPGTVESGCSGWMSPKPGSRAMLLVEARIVLHRARAERKQPGVDAVVLLATGARSGAWPRARRGPAGRSAPCARAAETRRERSPARRGRRRWCHGAPISKISASSMRERPVAGEGRDDARCAASPAAWDVPDGSASQNLLQRGDEGRAVFVGVHFGGGDDDQIVELGAGQQPRYRHAAEHALAASSLDDLGGGASRARTVNSLKKVSLSNFDALHARRAGRRASPHWRD